jgi:hypothetical protein
MAITNSKQAADFLNKRAPKGESLAFINESEARLLKANGGMGLALPDTGGVPSYSWYGDAWEAAKNWGKEAVKNVDFGEWVDIGTKAWDTFAKYKSEKGANEQEKATYDKYLQDTQNYEQAAEIAIAENLTPMAVAKPALTKADITNFTLVKDGGIIGLKNGGRPGYMMGDMVMEETTMASAPADVKESLNSIPPEMQAISQKLFQKAVEELTEQELQMLMAYMQKAAMETATAQAPMEEEMMTSETIMAANGGIMNAKRGLVDGPGGYAGKSVETINALVEPRGNPGVVTLDTFEDPRIVPEEYGLEPENRPAFPQIYDESEMIVTEPVGLNSAPNEVSKEEQYLIEGGVEFEKQLMEIFNAFSQRFPGMEDYENETFTDMIAMLQGEGVIDASDGKLIAMAEGLRGITPASIARTKQRIARGDTLYGNVPEEMFTELNSGGGAGIEALRKVRPDVVETMGFDMGGLSNPNMQMASAPDASSELNDMALMVYGVPLDQLTETQRLDLEDLLGSKNSIQPQETGIMQAANGGRAMYAYGQGPVMNQGIGTMMANDGMEMLDMNGMEKDYRFNGGFVPMGEYEKKDDVPARLSKNEFVFTADAVRAAGGGSIQKGAKKMYDTMKNLEAKV